MADDRQQGDLVLLPGQECLLTDETKGNVTMYVGPSATPLGGNLTPVVYDSRSGSFRRARGQVEEAIQQCPTAYEGQYLILHNPEKDGKHPTAGQPAPMTELQTGKTQVVHGPATMALFPGQWAEVLDGHRLDPSQYLLIEIVNDEEARAHWKDAEMKRQTAAAAAPAADAKGDEAPADSSTAVLDEQQIPDFTTGSRLVIRGDKFSFYMPPTGVRVVPTDPNSKSFVRKACTLERLQYCILVNAGGEKRFPKGPQVVYPEADEEFVMNDGRADDKRIHRAIELSKISGIYVKVTADYEDDNAENTKHRAGDELFVTGDTSAIYYPRPEHAVIRYGDREIHFATVIPDGEGVYVLNRLTGAIRIERGHKTLLPDPREDVIVRRVLDTNICELYFPGNREALTHNQMLTANRGGGAAAASAMNTDRYMTASFASGRDRGGDEEEGAKLAGDAFARGTTYSEPRSIVLDTKYNGAVRISPWNNYAVMINSASGSHRVVEGPATILLEWDESLEVLKLSTGTPKDHDRVIRTVYLKVKNNTVSHVIRAVTKDFCEVNINITLRVNFEVPADTPPDQVDTAKIKWFGVENYIEFLCVHMESLIRNTVRQYSVADFNENQTAIIRDTVLGKPTDDGTPRRGRTFDENGMRVYDVEVSSVSIDDDEIDRLLATEQRATFRQQMEKQEAHRKLERTQQAEKNAQDEAEAKAETSVKQHDLKMEQIARIRDEELAAIDAQKAKNLATLLAEKEQAMAAADGDKAKEELRQEIAVLQQDIRDLEASRTLARERASAEQKQGFDAAIQALALAELTAQTDAKTKLMAAVAPDVVAALEQLGDAQLAKAMTDAAANWAPLLGTQNLAGVLETVFSGTPLGDVVTRMVKRQ